MREILFRGKRKDDSEWVEGCLIKVGEYCCILEMDCDQYGNTYLDSELGYIDGQAVPVIPETVGRLVNDPCYTNYTEQRYFQGDIIELDSGKWKSGRTRLGIVVDEHCFTESGMGRVFPQDTLQARVIGNVWDNPELIGKQYSELYRYYNCPDTSVTKEDLKRNMEDVRQP